MALILSSMTVSHFKKYAFKLILLIQIVYLTLSVFIPAFPGWKMFSSVNLPAFKLIDVEQGLSIDHKKYMVPVFYTISDQTLIELAQFICVKENKTVQIEIDSKPPQVKVVNKNGCGFE